MTDDAPVDPARRSFSVGAVAGAIGAAWLAASPGRAATLASASSAGARMIARAIPSAPSETLPVIGLGTWQTFDVGRGAAERAPLRAVLGAFRAAGGRLLDTSPMYGASEEVLGELLPEAGGTSRYFVATKVWTSGRQEGIAQMQLSMQKLEVERVDLMQVHNLVDVATHLGTLRAWRERGIVRHVGITHYTRNAHGEVERVLQAERDVDFVQINYSLAEREAAERLLPLAQERKIAVLANRPFAEGALFARVRGKPVPPWLRDELDCASWAQVFLKYVVSHPAITAALPATSNPSHLADNLASGTGSMPDAKQRLRIAADFDAL